jgi:hypothetical protein
MLRHVSALLLALTMVSALDAQYSQIPGPDKANDFALKAEDVYVPRRCAFATRTATASGTPPKRSAPRLATTSSKASRSGRSPKDGARRTAPASSTSSTTPRRPASSGRSATITSSSARRSRTAWPASCSSMRNGSTTERIGGHAIVVCGADDLNSPNAEVRIIDNNKTAEVQRWDAHTFAQAMKVASCPSCPPGGRPGPMPSPNGPARRPTPHGPNDSPSLPPKTEPPVITPKTDPATQPVTPPPTSRPLRTQSWPTS